MLNTDLSVRLDLLILNARKLQTRHNVISKNLNCSKEVIAAARKVDIGIKKISYSHLDLPRRNVNPQILFIHNELCFQSEHGSRACDFNLFLTVFVRKNLNRKLNIGYFDFSEIKLAVGNGHTYGLGFIHLFDESLGSAFLCKGIDAEKR